MCHYFYGWWITAGRLTVSPVLKGVLALEELAGGVVSFTDATCVQGGLGAQDLVTAHCLSKECAKGFLLKSESPNLRSYLGSKRATVMLRHFIDYLCVWRYIRLELRGSCRSLKWQWEAQASRSPQFCNKHVATFSKMSQRWFASSETRTWSTLGLHPRTRATGANVQPCVSKCVCANTSATGKTVWRRKQPLGHFALSVLERLCSLVGAAFVGV